MCSATATALCSGAVPHSTAWCACWSCRSLLLGGCSCESRRYQLLTPPLQHLAETATGFECPVDQQLLCKVYLTYRMKHLACLSCLHGGLRLELQTPKAATPSQNVQDHMLTAGKAVTYAPESKTVLQTRSRPLVKAGQPQLGCGQPQLGLAAP